MVESPSISRLMVELSKLGQQRELLIEAIGFLERVRIVNNDKIDRDRLDLIANLTRAVF